jgi:hypothetical protein
MIELSNALAFIVRQSACRSSPTLGANREHPAVQLVTRRQLDARSRQQLT